MYAIVHLISYRKLTNREIDDIMSPFDENEVYQYDEKTNRILEPDISPQFTYDRYDIRQSIMYNKVSDCFIIIGPEGTVVSRRWFDGKRLKWINQEKKFSNYIQKNKYKWIGCYMYEILIHY